MLTAISDLEVESHEGQGQPCWYFPLSHRGQRRAYRRGDDAGPKTMLGDTGVAVHPDDPKVEAPDRQARHPAAGRPPDPDRGRRILRSGERLRRGEDHAGARLQRFRGSAAVTNLEAISIFDKFAPAERQGAGENTAGSTASNARKERSWRTWRRWALVEKIEPHTHAVPYGRTAAASRSSLS